MITFEPPIYQYKGMLILRDHLDEQTFYYLPNHPHFAVLEERVVDEDGEEVIIQRPAARFIKYRHDLDDWDPRAQRPTGGGLFFCDVDLSWPEEHLKKARGFIRQEAQLADDPTLVPPPWEKGTVQFFVLGRASELPRDDDDTGPGDEPPPPPDAWVPKMQAPGVPSLYGDNRAIVHVQLTHEAATLLEKSFDTETIVPIGVVYNLEFLVMRTAYRVKIEVDWHQVYKHFSESYQANFIFFGTDITKAVDDLVDERVIKIHTEVGDPEAETQAKMALDELKKLVLDKLFVPAIDPETAVGQDTASKVVKTIGQLAAIGGTMAMTGGMFPLTIGYSRKEIELNTLQTIDAEMSMSRAVLRQIAPQAHLSYLFGQAKLKKEDIVGEPIDLDDPFFDEFRLELVTTSGWKSKEHVELITAAVEYGDDPDNRKEFTFTEDGERHEYRANFDPQAGYDYKYEWHAVFGSDAPPGPDRIDVPAPPAAGSPGSPGGPGGPGGDTSESVALLPGHGGPLVLNPREYVDLRKVRIVPVRTLPFDVYPSIEVDMRYRGPGGFSVDRTEVLNAATEPPAWEIRIGEDWPREIDYHVTMHRTGQGPIIRDWRTTTDQAIVIDDPMVEGLRVWVRVAPSPVAVDLVLVDLVYEDLENGIREIENLQFDASNMRNLQWWKVNVFDPNRRTYRWRQTVFLTDDAPLEGPWLESDRGGIIAGAESVRQWPVEVRLQGPPLADVEVDFIHLSMKYDDDANAIHEVMEKDLRSLDDGFDWTLRLADLTRHAVSYELVYRMKNGRRVRKGPFSTDSRRIVIASSPVAG